MNNRALGHAYRARVLRFLARVGYGSTRQVAQAVWWRCDESTRKMAGRTLRWLMERGYIVTKRADDSVNGEQLSAVTKAGAEWLAREAEPLPYGKAHARDWLRHAHSHRTACNSVYAAVVGCFPDAAAWSELEVRAGLAPLNTYAWRDDGAELVKIPDLVATYTEGLEWLEVENSWRSDKDFKKLVSFLRAMFWTVNRASVRRVHFVIAAPGAKTIGARLRKALTHGPESGWPRQVKETDARILRDHVRISLLDHETLTLSSVDW